MNAHTLPPPTAKPDPRVDFFDQHAHRWDDNTQSNANTLHRLANLQDRLGVRFGLRVLEVGCGTGLITTWLTDCVGDGQVTAIDFSPSMLEKARAKGIAADFKQLDICHQAPAITAFDLALCFQSFPHFRDRAAALKHMAQSLKPRGRLVVLHLVGSQQINAFHREVGGAVERDLLPEPHQWPALMSAAGLHIQSWEDRPELFLLEAARG
jgi:demethylmenaquinone methyltransferase/2-methoxy-6-polyprenyl-1,4-benzoquinol methylase